MLDIAILHLRLDHPLDVIAAKFDLPLSSVYAAMAFYYDHRGEMEQAIRDDEALAEAPAQPIPIPPSGKAAEAEPCTARIRFHLDKNVDPDVAHALRKHGIDVTTTLELGMRGQSDEEQLAFAQREGRVLITCDTDFLAIAKGNLPHAGIAFAHHKRSLGDVIRAITLIYEVLDPAEMNGQVEYL